MRPQMGQNRPRPRRKAIGDSLLDPPNAPPSSTSSAKLDLHRRVASRRIASRRVAVLVRPMAPDGYVLIS